MPKGRAFKKKLPPKRKWVKSRSGNFSDPWGDNEKDKNKGPKLAKESQINKILGKYKLGGQQSSVIQHLSNLTKTPLHIRQKIIMEEQTHSDMEPEDSSTQIPKITPKKIDLDEEDNFSKLKNREFYLVESGNRHFFVRFTQKNVGVNRSLYKKGSESAGEEGKGLDPKIKKYFKQRFTLFSKFSEGIQIDTEGWYSVTPESVAKLAARRLSYGTIMDGFAGVGGNAIQVNFKILQSLLQEMLTRQQLLNLTLIGLK